jgi:hypothetical protein
MNQKVKPEQLSGVIMDSLKEYRKLSADAMKDAVEKTAKDVKNEIQDKAPVRTGRYKKSWTVTKTEENADRLVMTVHAGRYQLTHLLEHGHAKRGGGRVAAIPHIAPAEETGEKQLEEEITRSLENG